MPMREEHRGTAPMRVPRVVLEMLDEAGSRLSGERGGRWSRGETARVVVREWLDARDAEDVRSREVDLDDLDRTLADEDAIRHELDARLDEGA